MKSEAEKRQARAKAKMQAAIQSWQRAGYDRQTAEKIAKGEIQVPRRTFSLGPASPELIELVNRAISV